MTAGEQWDDSPQELFDQAPFGYLSTAPDGLIVNVNQTFLSWTGYAWDDLVGRRRLRDLLTGGGRIYHETHVAPLLRIQGEAREIALDVVCADGTRLPTLISAVVARDAEGAPRMIRTTVFNATDRRRYETELLHARRAAEESERRVRVLHQIVADLAAVPTVTGVAEVMVAAGPAFAAADSALWVVDGDRLVPAAGMVELPPVSVTDLYVGETPEQVAADFPELAAALPGRSALVLPLTSHDRVLGVLLYVFAGPRTFADGEVEIARLLGHQVGQALDRARLYDEARRLAVENERLYQREREIAETLQRSLLAGDPPADPRFTVETFYQAGIRGLQVGGDWYDAFLITTDKLAVVVGDVVGRGLHAASTMGQLRSAVRALAAAEAGPARLMEQLDRFVEQVESARMASVAYAEITLSTGEMVYTCAGHPPPLLLRPETPPEFLWGGRSAPLGSRAGRMVRTEEALSLPRASQLLLYTDGLIERRDRTLDEGFALLSAEFATLRGAPTRGRAARLAGALVGTAHPDDVCLLCVSVGAGPRLERGIAAEAHQISPLRQDLPGWLVADAVDEDSRDALLLACSEAVEHGYRGSTQPGESAA